MNTLFFGCFFKMLSIIFSATSIGVSCHSPICIYISSIFSTLNRCLSRLLSIISCIFPKCSSSNFLCMSSYPLLVFMDHHRSLRIFFSISLVIGDLRYCIHSADAVISSLNSAEKIELFLISDQGDTFV